MNQYLSIIISVCFFIIFNYITIYDKKDKGKKYNVSCDEKLQNSCMMYNFRDINSKCTSMCMLKYKSSFSGNHIKKNSVNICECNTNLEQFSDIKANDVILPQIVPDDKSFSDRNYVQNQEENRYNKLIFG